MVYASAGKTLKTDIANIQTSLQEKETYNDNSILMSINPYNKTVARIVYYIDTGYQIMPGSTYQNIDYSDRIIEMYMTYLTGGELYAQMARELSTPTKIQYVREILNIASNPDTDMISIDLSNINSAACQEMIDIIKKGLKEIYPKATSSIAEHKLTEISEDIYTTVDLDLETLQNTNIKTVADLADSLDAKSKELKDWETSRNPNGIIPLGESSKT